VIDQKEPDPPDGWEDPDYRWMDYYMSDHIVDANKTDTPRTDEAEANAMRSGIPVSMVSRSIERELNHARDWIRKHAPMEDWFFSIGVTATAKSAANGARRLDWMVGNEIRNHHSNAGG